MKEVSLSIPRIAVIAGTRVAAGAGLGLLIADILQPKPRRALGWTLLAIGILSTPPLVANVLGKLRSSSDEPSDSP